MTDLAGILVSESPRADVAAEYLVMVAQAGRTDRTGAKVHLALLTVRLDGTRTISAAQCSANGSLRGGAIVRCRDFSAVTCKRCGAGEDAAAARNARRVIVPV